MKLFKEVYNVVTWPFYFIKANLLFNKIKTHTKTICRDGFVEKRDRRNQIDSISFDLGDYSFLVYNYHNTIYLYCIWKTNKPFVVFDHSDSEGFYPYGYLDENGLDVILKPRSVCDMYEFYDCLLIAIEF